MSHALCVQVGLRKLSDLSLRDEAIAERGSARNRQAAALQYLTNAIHQACSALWVIQHSQAAVRQDYGLAAVMSVEASQAALPLMHRFVGVPAPQLHRVPLGPPLLAEQVHS